MPEITKVEKEVYQRLNGDATLMAVLNAVYSGEAAEDAAMPYAVTFVRVPEITLAFDLDIPTVQITVDLYFSRANTTYDILDIQSAIDRVYGDSTAGSAPTYGLHRFKPTLEGTWSGDTIACRSVEPAHDAQTLVYSMNFEMIESR